MVGDSVMVPGWSAPNDTRPASVPVATVAAPAGFAGVSGLPPVSRSSYTVCATVAGSLHRNVVLDTDGEAAGQRDEVAVRVGRNNDRRQVDGDQRLVVVVRAQPVVELVQQRERVRARRRVVICSVNT